MPATTFYLNQTTAESIEITHGNNLKNLTLTQNGFLIGRVENKKELIQGQSFTLPDTRVLSVRLKRKWGVQEELEILLDGQPLPGSRSDPQQRLKQVTGVLFFLAGVNAGLGLVAELTAFPLLVNLGLGAGSIIVGLVNLLLAYFIKAKLLIWALYAAIGLLVLDTLLALVFAAETSSNPITGIFLKMFFIFILVKGVPALKILKAERQLLEEETFGIA